MHKSSERSNNGCVWNEDAPTVVSCAFFRLSEPVVIFNRRLFCVPPYRSDGKDTAMKNNDSKKRKSGFNPNRTCYLTADGKYYCYERWDDDAKCVVTQRLEVGKDLSLELTIMLDESDHDMDLQDRYEGELRDPLFDAKVNSYKADPDNEDAVDPWDTLADKGGSPEDAMFAEPEQENPQAEQARRVIDEECTESQQDFFFEHFGKGTPLEEMRQAEAEQTGKLPSSAAMTNRKNKIIDKVAKSFGVERVKRHKYPKKD